MPDPRWDHATLGGKGETLEVAKQEKFLGLRMEAADSSGWARGNRDIVPDPSWCQQVKVCCSRGQPGWLTPTEPAARGREKRPV